MTSSIIDDQMDLLSSESPKALVYMVPNCWKGLCVQLNAKCLIAPAYAVTILTSVPPMNQMVFSPSLTGTHHARILRNEPDANVAILCLIVTFAIITETKYKILGVTNATDFALTHVSL